jgi:hypothetical protein
VNRNSPVGIATGPVSVSGGVKTGSGAHSVGAGGSFLGGKAAWLEAEHSPPSTAQVKNGVAIPPFPHTSFVTLDGCLVDCNGPGRVI